MIVRVVIAGTNGNGDPDFYFCKVDAPEDAIAEGDHYVAARIQAQTDGYEGEMVAFDEDDIRDGPKFLLDQFVWDSATTVKV